MRKIDEIILHHSAFDASDDTYNDVRKIYRYHRSIGYKDIGYHYIIGKDGIVINGRPLSQVGAHCKGHNSRSIGICLIGNFDNYYPSRRQVISLFNLVSDLRLKFNKNGDLLIYPHNFYGNTACPGKFLIPYCTTLNHPEYL